MTTPNFILGSTLGFVILSASQPDIIDPALKEAILAAVAIIINIATTFFTGWLKKRLGK